jgi:hypothetical protein
MNLEDIKEIGWYVKDLDAEVTYQDCVVDLFCIKKVPEEFSRYLYPKLIVYVAEKFDLTLLDVELAVCGYELFGEDDAQVPDM